MNGFSLHHESSIGVCSNDKSVYESSSRRNGFMDPTIQLQNPPCRDLDPATTNYENSYFSYAVSKYVDDILMEEDLEGKTCMLQDCLALQTTEKSFYDVLGQKYPPSPHLYSPFSNPNDNHFVDYSSICNQAEPGSCHTPISLVDSSESAFLVRNGVGESDSFMPVVTGKEGRGRKNHHSEDGEGLEGRWNNKRSVPSLEESEQSDLFDELMFPKGGSYDFVQCPLFDAARNGAILKLHCKEKKNGSNGRIMRMMKQGDTSEMVDLWSLLTQCAQAVASDDQRIATELLKQIRRYSSPFGDGTERLAHYFANGLEARLAGTGSALYSPAFVNRSSVSDILKAYLAYFSAVPFRKVSNFTTNRVIGKLAEKATRVHIIDFGISYGFQWPYFIQRQSFRPGGPPKIRITGIELPQPGFRPAERVEETGRRLKRVAEACNVPFEYKSIAQRWETIQLEDLKIDRDEVTAVTCMNRLDNLPADTVVLNSPRDALLNLIKRINPEVFVHGVINGTYNSPFFISRFREALFHFSALFDMFEATLPSEDQGRLIFERELIGRHAMNVIACEGLERINSPETYKQWQARNLRNGFKELQLDQELFKRAKEFVKMDYHKDFVVDKHGRESWESMLFEVEMYAGEIMRIERPETYKQWQRIVLREMKMQIVKKNIVLLAMNPGKMMDGVVISMIRGEATRGVNNYDQQWNNIQANNYNKRKARQRMWMLEEVVEIGEQYKESG
ncbi:hypothetical protein EZV62_002706 [Acer yangbiense]|uniref:Uncharacterized protein n=1 Tax=Acer yangbiense TaxID=1000413 RepID=A0A5C7IXV5_9ROSI|nr:hypothetical protein EZV62_002706 [Acer yangbiense]